MPALFDTGFFVRKPAWHEQGIVLDYYPGREEAMKLAGHDFKVVERPIAVIGKPLTGDAVGDGTAAYLGHANGFNGVKTDVPFKALVQSGSGEVFTVVRDSYEVIQNDAAYDVAELLFEQGFQYETGITLDGGRLCALTLLLDEPIVLPGDDSPVLPFGCLSWSHDGSASLRVRSGTIRQVCANTVAASEAEGKRLGTDFTFRHTKNVHARIEDAKAAVKGTRENFDVFKSAMLDLCKLKVTPEQRDLYVSTIIGDKGGILSQNAATSDRVKNNIETERAKLNALFMGQTIPEGHVLTGYGLHLAGVEYFDHLRGYRSQDSYVKRTLLADNPAKANLIKTIHEVVAA
jgi:phage/plasmid-like protein (TIGR03299 family)